MNTSYINQFLTKGLAMSTSVQPLQTGIKINRQSLLKLKSQAKEQGLPVGELVQTMNPSLTTTKTVKISSDHIKKYAQLKSTYMRKIKN